MDTERQRQRQTNRETVGGMNRGDRRGEEGGGPHARQEDMKRSCTPYLVISHSVPYFPLLDPIRNL